MQRIRIKEIQESDIGKTLYVCGWVRTVREQKSFAFIELNDGSTLKNLQIIIDDIAQIKDVSTGAAIRAKGTLVASPGGGQKWELKAEQITLFGTAPEDYPLQKKRHSLEFLRTIAHLRPRTNLGGAVARVRNCLAFATHRFFQEKGFLHLHSPIITTSDCEGGGEQFLVSDSKGKEFFGKPAYLTVSAQLEAEVYATAFTDIYTFGPTFRAENSNTSRHLAEFWMVEPEMAFADINDNIENAEAYIKYALSAALKECPQDLELFDQFVSKGLLDRLRHIVDSSFVRITYTEAIDILLAAKKEFVFPVRWGSDLQSEHERYLAEEHFKKPVVVTNYPKEIKAFYMRLNDDNKTVAAMDILVPGIGELVGGSQREEREEMLLSRMKELNLPIEEYWWYLELRRFGTVPHAGYGVGFERLMLLATGMENIRDVIPFPRTPGHAEF